MKKFGETSSEQKSFISAYAEYLSYGFFNNLFDETSKLFLLTDEHNRLKNTNFIQAERTNCFHCDGYDQWRVDSDDAHFYFRFATGIILMAKSERFLKLDHTSFKNIGIFWPPSNDFILGVNSFKQLMGMMGLTAKDVELNWGD